MTGKKFFLMTVVLISILSFSVVAQNWGAYGGGTGVTGGSGESVSTPVIPPPKAPSTPQGWPPQERYVAPPSPPARTAIYKTAPVTTTEQGTPKTASASLPSPSSGETKRQYIESQGGVTQGAPSLKSVYNPCLARRTSAVCLALPQCYWTGHSCQLQYNSYNLPYSHVNVGKSVSSGDYADSGYGEGYYDFNFRIITKPLGSVAITPGSSTSYVVGVDVLSGSTSSMQLGVTGVPKGASVSMARTEDPRVVVLTVSALQDAIPGTYRIGIKGTDGKLVRGANIPLTIAEAPTISGSFVRGIDFSKTPNKLILWLVPLIIWEAVWKSIGLWKSARNNQLKWFIALLIFNTVGILPIVYLKFFQKRKR